MRPAPTPSSTDVATERRLVTVLFADLVGHTSRSEEQDPEDVARFLADYFERSHDVITRFGGLVEKYIGDAVMAVWGARAANEDDAERAVRAGLELQDTIGKLAAEAGDPDIALRVGVLTGEAAVRTGGNESTGMIVGDLVNSASRLQSLAEPGTVFVGPTTYRAASNAIAFEPAGSHAVKGRREPLTTWRAIRVVAERGGRGRVEGIDPPFVGRIAELQLLKDVLGAVVQTGRSRLVSIIGEPGIGKSALVWELRKYADGLAGEIFWNRGRSLSYGSEGVVHRAVSDLLRGRIGVTEDDPPAKVASALDVTLDRFVPDPAERSRIRPWLASLLGLAESPAGDRSEFDAAIRSFVGHMAGVGPTVLVFDDLHWGDGGLIDLVEQLPDWMPDAPVLVIAIARPELIERRPGWASGRRGVIALRLGPLPDEFMGDLLRGVMGDLDTDLLADMVDRAAGIPLYAVELARAVMATDPTISAETGTPSSMDLADFTIPETLQSLIGSRIDRLDEDLRATLQDAAILGQAFTLDGLMSLAALTGRDEATLTRHIAALVDQELIEPIRDERSPLRGGYRFVQKLVRQVAHNRMSRQKRRSRHLASAKFFESRTGPDAAAIAADHYLSALDLTRDAGKAAALRERASGVLLAALHRTAALYAHEEVISLGTRILDLELNLPIDEQAKVKERMAFAASALIRPDDAARLAEEALDLSRQCGDIHGVRRSAALLALVNLEGLRVEAAVDVLTEQLSAVPDPGADPGLAEMSGLLARAEFLRGNADAALDFADRTLAVAEEHDLKAVVADALVTKATVLGIRGRPIEARLLLESVIEFAQKHELNPVSLRAYINLGAVVPPTALGGDPTLEAIRIGRRVGNRNLTLLATANRVDALIGRAEWDEAEALLADPLWESAGGWVGVARLYARAAVDALRGRTTDAIRSLEAEMSRTPGELDPDRLFNLEAAAALVRLLAGTRSEAMAFAETTLATIDTIPWIDATARLLFLTGTREQIAELARRPIPRAQTNDDRLGPFLQVLNGVIEGDDDAVDDASRHIDAVAKDGLVLDQVLWTTAVARVLERGSSARRELLDEAIAIAEANGMLGLLPFLDAGTNGDA